MLLHQHPAVAAFPEGLDELEGQVRVVREAEKYLDEIKARLAAKGIQRVETSVWYGPPASAIVEAAKVGKVDLIVMSTHGRSGIGRWVLGSVADRVLRGATSPVLLVRAGVPVDAAVAGPPAVMTQPAPPGSNDA